MKNRKQLVAGISLVIGISANVSGQDGTPTQNGVNSTPCISGATGWVLGGNNIIPTVPNSSGGIGPNHTDVGTCNNYPFILKANNFKSVWVTQSGNVGINTGNPFTALDVTNPNGSSPRTNFRIFGDADGNVESTGDIRMHWATGQNCLFNEGAVGNGVNRMIIQNGTGRVGIGEANPAAALEIKSSNPLNFSNFQIHGDVYGNVLSTSHMNLNYAPGSEFQINEGPSYSTTGYTGINRFKIFRNTGYILAGKPNMYTPLVRFHITNEPNPTHYFNGMSQYGLKVDQYVQSITGSGPIATIVGSEHVVSAPAHIPANGVGLQASSYIEDQFNNTWNYNWGLEAIGRGGDVTIGVRSVAQSFNDNEPGIESGLRSTAHAFLGYATPTPNGDAFGIEVYSYRLPHQTGDIMAGRFWGDVEIFGNVPGSTAPAGSPPPAGVPALFVKGNAVTTGGAWYVSDKQLKTAIEPLGDMSDLISKLNPVSYEFKNSEYRSLNLPHGKQIGLIAQELEEIFPELVMQIKGKTILGPDSQVIRQPSIKTVNYVGLIPVLLAGFQEQKAENDKQRAEIEELKSQIQQIKSTQSSQPDQIESSVKENNLQNSLVLDQNAPNPFSESTEIGFNIPENSKEARLVIMSDDGRISKTVLLNQRGKGQITVFGADLSKGTYSYSLIIDGVKLETKRMIKQ